MITLHDLRKSLVFSVIRRGESERIVQGREEPVADGAIHVWSAPYSKLELFYPHLSALINQDETKRALCFKRTCDARRYVLRHGLLRAVLARYSHETPQEIRFVRKKNGKPDLDPEGKGPGIRFSLSGTDEMVSLGITRGTDIGLDIARVQPRDSFPTIAHYLFTQKERDWIAQGARDQRVLRFIRIWSLKEALLKATGSGVRMMQEADVSGIMADTYLNGRYPFPVGSRDLCIHESVCGAGHHRVIVTINHT
jgi:phosphopantetheinyl transferase